LFNLHHHLLKKTQKIKYQNSYISIPLNPKIFIPFEQHHHHLEMVFYRIVERAKESIGVSKEDQ
jgi:hypothetical protein